MNRLAALLGLCAALVACQTTGREVISTADAHGASCCSTNASSCCDMAACGCECCGGDSDEGCEQMAAPAGASTCCSAEDE